MDKVMALLAWAIVIVVGLILIPYFLYHAWKRILKGKIKVKRCFLDGVNQCNSDITCEQCIKNEVEWRESWLKQSS